MLCIPSIPKMLRIFEESGKKRGMLIVLFELIEENKNQGFILELI